MDAARISASKPNTNIPAQKTGIYSAVGDISSKVQSDMKNKIKQAIEEASSPSYHKDKLEKTKIYTLTHKIADIAESEYKSASKLSSSRVQAAASKTSSIRGYANSLAGLLKGRKLDISL